MFKGVWKYHFLYCKIKFFFQLRYNKARAGHGSTYDFFDDDLNSPFAHASPYHSPNQERRPSWQQKYQNATYLELQPSIVVQEQHFEQRKPRSYSIEPRRVTSPHIDTSKLSESFDSTNKVTRSVSDSKKDKAETSRPLDKVPFWQGSRPASMIVPNKAIDDISSYMIKDNRRRSGSFGLISPPDDIEARRNESFRSTSSDTALTSSDLLRNEIRRQIKPSSSAPEVSKVLKGVRRRHSDGGSETPYSRRCIRPNEAGSVSSSSTSVSTERGALSRDNSFKNRHRDITELDETSQDESTMGRSTPSYFLELDENSDLQESVIGSGVALVNQHSQTDTSSVCSERECQTDVIDNIVLKIDIEVQTEFSYLCANSISRKATSEDTSIQCDLMQCASDLGDPSIDPHATNCERAVASVRENFSFEGKNLRVPFNEPRMIGLRHYYSENDLRKSSVQGLHYRSLSEDGQLDILTDANGNHESPLARKRTASSGQLSPGMLALQFLSSSLESSLLPKEAPENGASRAVLQRSGSPLSLRKMAMFNASPVSKRKEMKNGTKGTVKDYLAKMPLKRASWHVDSVSELEKLEKELLHGSKDDLSIAKVESKTKAEEKPKRPERKKGKGKKEDKKKKKRDAEAHGVVSGPNMDKRKAQRVFLENSWKHEKP